MTNTNPSPTDESAAKVGDAIFESRKDEDTSSSSSWAEEMRDKVGAIHKEFDKDRDGYLNFDELRSLQLVTSGDDMKSSQYEVVCRMLDCEPGRGLTLDALRLTYASEGADAEEDYFKVFPDRKKGAEKRSTEKEDGNDNDDDVIEVGEGGVDISS